MNKENMIIDKDMLVKYVGDGGDVTIPDGITHISGFAFENCHSLNSVNIPDSVTKIGNGAFKSCVNLTKITIPESVIYIGDRAFAFCDNLKKVIVKSNDCILEGSPFRFCHSLESLILPAECVLETNAFDDNGLVPPHLADSLPALYRNLSDGDLVKNINRYGDCFGYNALTDMLITRLKYKPVPWLKDRKKQYMFFEKLITVQNGGKLTRLMIEKLPLTADKNTCNSVACALVLLYGKVIPERLFRIYNWLKEQKYSKKALEILNHHPEIIKFLNSTD